MSNLLPVSKTLFASKRWKKVPNYLFTVQDPYCALSLQEIPRAVVDMPLGFVKSNGKFTLIAILGLHEGRNLYVDPRGNWRGRYVPALFRSYPFVLAQNEDVKDQLVLCINEDSGLITDDPEQTPFFDTDGELGPELKQLVSFLEALHVNRIATTKMCAVLDEYELIKPWNIEVQFTDGPHRVEGLYGIDEKALNELSDEQFLALRRLGALQIAYCQLLSMQHVTMLIERVKALGKSGVDTLSDELSFDGFDSDGNISFDNL